mmetsp:Transcript_15956/g.64376  ORF Transcript_15956/g.64376 Transcript_15956/m.64376 type:complete len:248 (-) Transcript_15956:354-1097(-)
MRRKDAQAAQRSLLVVEVLDPLGEGEDELLEGDRAVAVPVELAPSVFREEEVRAVLLGLGGLHLVHLVARDVAVAVLVEDEVRRDDPVHEVVDVVRGAEEDRVAVVVGRRGVAAVGAAGAVGRRRGRAGRAVVAVVGQHRRRVGHALAQPLPRAGRHGARLGYQRRDGLEQIQERQRHDELLDGDGVVAVDVAQFFDALHVRRRDLVRHAEPVDHELELVVVEVPVVALEAARRSRSVGTSWSCLVA